MTETASDTTPVREQHVFDEAALCGYLERSGKLPNFQAPLKVTQFGHGQSNPTFLLTCANGQQFVLRKQPPGSLISKTAHRVDREFLVMRALQSTPVPVPEMYLLCGDTAEDPSPVGKPFYVMEFMKGRLFKNVGLPEVAVADRREYWLALVEALAALHSVDFRGVGLGDYGKDSGYFERQTGSLSAVSRAQEAVSEAVPRIPGFDDLARALREHQPPDAAAICHGDFKMDNVIFHPTEPRVIAVLDWEMSTIGHYGADLGNCLSPLYPPEGDDEVARSAQAGAQFLFPLEPGKAKESGLPTREELIERYCKVRKDLNLSDELRRAWYYVSFYQWKTSVILQGIAARAARGQASSPQARSVGELAGAMGQAGTVSMRRYQKMGQARL